MVYHSPHLFRLLERKCCPIKYTFHSFYFPFQQVSCFSKFFPISLALRFMRVTSQVIFNVLSHVGGGWVILMYFKETFFSGSFTPYTRFKSIFSVSELIAAVLLTSRKFVTTSVLGLRIDVIT